MHKRSIGSDGTFAYHLFVCTKVLSAKDKKVLSLNSVATLACLWRAQMFYLTLLKTQKFYLYVSVARFCKNFKIIHIPVERQDEDDSNDVKITLQMLYPDGKNNCKNLQIL